MLRDSDGTEYARFPDAEAVLSDAERYPATETDTEDADAWIPVKRPFLLAVAFDAGRVPDRREWDVVVVPGDADRPADLTIVEKEPKDTTPSFANLRAEGREWNSNSGSSQGNDDRNGNSDGIRLF